MHGRGSNYTDLTGKQVDSLICLGDIVATGKIQCKCVSCNMIQPKNKKTFKSLLLRGVTSKGSKHLPCSNKDCKFNNYRDNRVGETNIAKNGQKMTIIVYRGYDDIDVQFEDGTIVTNKLYKYFKNGGIKNPNCNNSNRIGEINIANNGQKMTIIAYRDSKSIDIQFEDGTVVINKKYGEFKSGEIKNPNYSKVGETSIATNGQKMTIVVYRDAKDIDIQFEDGTIVTGTTYAYFKKGWVKNSNYNSHDKTGETNIANNGQKMTIINYRGWRSIDIQFEDGTIVYNKNYKSFKEGNVGNPNFNYGIKTSFIRVGGSNIASNGQKMTIIAYRKYSDIDIQFEDGTVVYNKSYKSFEDGIAEHESLIKRWGRCFGTLFGIEILDFAYRYNDEPYYICRVNNDSEYFEDDILSLSEIRLLSLFGYN